jgi:hypothetical protein
LIPVNRGKDFPAEVLGCGNQRINVIRAQLNFRCLACARFLFEILPAFAHTLSLLVRTVKLRDGRWRFSDRTRFGQPIAAIEQRRVTVKTPIHSGKASNCQHGCEYQQHQAAPCETAQPFSPRRRFNPSIHQGEYIVTPDLRFTGSRFSDQSVAAIFS